MEGEVHNSAGLTGCCPDMILYARGNYGERGNELGINLCTYQDISESAGVQGDFTDPLGS